MILLRIIAFGSLPHAKQVMSSRWCKIPNPELKQLQKEKQPLLPQEYHEQGTFGMSQNGYWFQNFSLYCTSSYFIFNESKVIPQGRGLCHQRPTETDLERLKHMNPREDPLRMTHGCQFVAAPERVLEIQPSTSFRKGFFLYINSSILSQAAWSYFNCSRTGRVGATRGLPVLGWPSPPGVYPSQHA